MVETNDPLNMGRVRVRVPELHSLELPDNKCPWAIPSENFGGPGTGKWSNVCIGDQVFINMEKDHPYGLIYSGSADSTRRQMYPLESVHYDTPPAFKSNNIETTSETENMNSQQAGDQSRINRKTIPRIRENPSSGVSKPNPKDFDENYLPSDKRPMSSGWKDRYGHLIIMRSYGFFPETHISNPIDPGIDALSKQKFDSGTSTGSGGGGGSPANRNTDGDFIIDERIEPPVENEISLKFFENNQVIEILLSEPEDSTEDLSVSRVSISDNKYSVPETSVDLSYSSSSGNLSGTVTIETENDEDLDGLTTKAEQKGKNKDNNEPKVNSPDSKYLAFISKYGHIMTLNDGGYDWKKSEEKKPSRAITQSGRSSSSTNPGEFHGEPDRDREFEVKRWLELQKIINENSPSGKDQRRYSAQTRYGHKFEMRDVGWNKSRAGEFTEESRTIARGTSDERWLKLRTKGGHLIQAIDVGFDSEEDKFVKRKLLDEVDNIDEERNFNSKDKRQIRFVTRYGFKFVLDDRGSDPKDSDNLESPRGNGLLIKGRRDNKGFGIEFNEKNDINALKLYTPKDSVLEMNDKEEFIILNTKDREISRPWMKLRDNEFSTSSSRSGNPEQNSFHLLMDKKNKYTRLKTPLQQGIEMRDESGGGPWTEIRDGDDRGFWMSRARNFGVWRNIDEEMFCMLDDGSNSILIQNNKKEGKIQIFCEGNVEIASSKAVNFKGQSINFRSASNINFQAGSQSAVLSKSGFGTTGDINCKNVNGFLPGAESGSGAQAASPRGGNSPNIVREVREELKPKDDIERAFAPNVPLKDVDSNVIAGN